MKMIKFGWLLALLLPALVFGQVGGGGSGGLTAPVALSSLDTQGAATIVGRASGAGTGVPVALTAAQTRAIIAPLPLTDVATQAEATILGRAVGAGTGVPVALSAAQAKGVSSLIRQKSTTIDKTVVSTTSTVLPDGSIPQISEGTSYGTYLFTPTQSDSVLRITANGTGTWGGTLASIIVALFRDGGADAVAATSARAETANGLAAWSISHSHTVSTTDQITYELRIGRSAAAGTIYVPASSTTFGASGPMVTVTIEELAP